LPNASSSKEVHQTILKRRLSRSYEKVSRVSTSPPHLCQSICSSLGYDPEFGKGDDMFKDLALSKDLLQEFHEKSSSDYPVSIMVLQYSCWPYEPKKGNRDIDLPPQVKLYYN